MIIFQQMINIIISIAMSHFVEYNLKLKVEKQAQITGDELQIIITVILKIKKWLREFEVINGFLSLFFVKGV